MQKKWLKILGVVLLFVFALVYIYYYRPLTDDELYGYGFGINILNGLIPYKDFNMIITPLFSYVMALIIGVFGKHLIIYHIVISLIVVGVTVITYKKLGFSSIIIYFLMLIYPYTGYNMFSLLLFLILINIDEKKNKKYLVLEVLLISMMILTKQVLGILVIPSLIYSKNRKKSFLIYFGIGLIFVLFLLFNNCLYDFFDYCLFGMFDFTSKNNEGFNVLLFIEIGVIIYLTYKLIKCREREVFYILCFQIMCFPIVNYHHFVISFVPVVYYLFINKSWTLKFMATSFMAAYFISFSITVMVKDNTYLYTSNSKLDNFYSGRRISNHLNGTISDINDVIDDYGGYRYYFLGNFAYLIKLSNGEDIDKFDLINDGNMGYDGANRYIKEIDEYCNDNKCLFVLESVNDETTNQTNVDILEYVEDNYVQELGGSVYKIFVN